MLRRYKHVLKKLAENRESYIPLQLLPDGHGRDGHGQNATNNTMRELVNFGWVVFNAPDMYLITSVGLAEIDKDLKDEKTSKGPKVDEAIDD